LKRSFEEFVVPSPQRSVTVTSTATLLCSADPSNRPVYLQIIGNKTVYIGDSTVTTANGFPIVKHGAPIMGQLGPGQALYGICAAAETEDVRVFSVPED
jgi:hypothetical protein